MLDFGINKSVDFGEVKVNNLIIKLQSFDRLKYEVKENLPSGRTLSFDREKEKIVPNSSKELIVKAFGAADNKDGNIKFLQRLKTQLDKTTSILTKKGTTTKNSLWYNHRSKLLEFTSNAIKKYNLDFGILITSEFFIMQSIYCGYYGEKSKKIKFNWRS